MSPDDVQKQEDWGNEACHRAATLFWLKPEQAESCDGGEHRCPYCPWRDPLQTPSDGDMFQLPNGKRIEIDFVNMAHVVEPELQYSFVDWMKWSGGRKSYMRKLSDWSKVSVGATVLRHGKKPSRLCVPGKEERQASAHAAFETANRKLPPKDRSIT